MGLAALFTFVVLVQLCCAADNEVATICTLNDGRNAVYLLMPESQPPESTVSKLPVQGLTFGPTPEIELRLVGGEELVSLDARSKELKLKKAVDRDGPEGTVKFEATVECRSLLPDDNFKVNISVFVNVQDVNDNAPVFDRPQYSFNITEELPVGTVVFTDLLATDADSDGPNSDLHYEIVDGPFSQLLTITDPSKGVVRVGRRIDFESVANFTVSVRAKDSGHPELQSVTTLQVTVLDVDDLNPVFEHDSYDATIDEKGLVHMEPGPIRARDGDTLRATVAYSLSGEHSNLFAIDETGQLENRGYRSPRPIVLLVHARQTDRAERQSQASVRIRVGGKGDSADLRFTRSNYSVQVVESAKIGAVLVQVVAVGGDPSEPMTYWLVEPGAVPMFALDKDTGELTLVASLDYENHTEYRFAVQARHSGQTASATVHILVENVNEHSPVFDQLSYEFDLQGDDDSIGTIRAIDNDAGDRVRYVLLNYADLFTIDADGQIQRSNSLGNETYDLLVAAEDSGDPPRRTHVHVFVHASDQPVGQLLAQASTSLLYLLIGLGAALLVLLCCCLLLAIYVCRLRKKDALNAPYRTWRTRRLDKLILANPDQPRRPPLSISEPQSQTHLPSSVAQTLQRYQQVSIAGDKEKMSCDDSRSSSDQTYSPHGSSSPLHRDSPELRHFGRDDDVHTTDHDRTLSISYASLALFPPPPSPSRSQGADLVPVTVARSGGTKTVYF